MLSMFPYVRDAKTFLKEVKQLTVTSEQQIEIFDILDRYSFIICARIPFLEIKLEHDSAFYRFYGVHKVPLVDLILMLRSCDRDNWIFRRESTKLVKIQNERVECLIDANQKRCYFESMDKRFLEHIRNDPLSYATFHQLFSGNNEFSRAYLKFFRLLETPLYQFRLLYNCYCFVKWKEEYIKSDYYLQLSGKNVFNLMFQTRKLENISHWKDLENILKSSILPIRIYIHRACIKKDDEKSLNNFFNSLFVGGKQKEVYSQLSSTKEGIEMKKNLLRFSRKVSGRIFCKKSYISLLFLRNRSRLKRVPTNFLYRPSQQIFKLYSKIALKLFPSNIFNRSNLNNLLKLMNILICFDGSRLWRYGKLLEMIDVSNINSKKKKKKKNENCETLMKLIIAVDLSWKLLTKYFYITETSVNANKLFFIYRSHWREMVNSKQFENYISKSCQRIEERTGGGGGDGYGKKSSCRILPKLAMNRCFYKFIGFRLINSWSKEEKEKNKRILTCLKYVMETLDEEKKRMFKGVGLEGINKINDTLTKWKEKNKNGMNFCVLADITQCFDNIILSKLLDGLEVMIPDRVQLIIQNINSCTLSKNNSYRTFYHVNERKNWKKRKLSDSMNENIRPNKKFRNNEEKSMEKFERKPIDQLSIIRRQSKLELWTKDNLLNELRSLFFNSQFLLNNKIYKRIIGLSHSNCLSPLLTRIYLGMSEVKLNWSNNIRHIDNDRLFFTVRYVDDYIFFFNNKSDAVRHVHLLKNEMKEFNIKFNLAKVKKNFDETNNGKPDKTLKWCGNIMDPSLNLIPSSMKILCLDEMLFQRKNFDIKLKELIQEKFFKQLKCVEKLYKNKNSYSSKGILLYICRSFATLFKSFENLLRKIPKGIRHHIIYRNKNIVFDIFISNFPYPHKFRHFNKHVQFILSKNSRCRTYEETVNFNRIKYLITPMIRSSLIILLLYLTRKENELFSACRKQCDKYYKKLMKNKFIKDEMLNGLHDSIIMDIKNFLK
ncbi:hypothetical protein SNEBB_009640 [Seison nebaliae]|nr:hypothetical protein SNEBB_009640 [Seison nebaliae]